MTRTRVDLQERIRQKQAPVSPVSRLASVPLREEILATQDCVCLTVAPRVFAVPWILTRSRRLMDATGTTRRFASVRDAVIRL